MKSKGIVCFALYLLLASLSAYSQELVDGFDYAIGESHDEQGNLLGIPEGFPEEKNKVFRDKRDCQPNNERSFGVTSAGAWYNANDVGSFYDASGGLHPGEDWHLNGGDEGEPVKAIANGYVEGIGYMCGDTPTSCGWRIILRHNLPNPDGDGLPARALYSVYGHITSSNHEDGVLAESAEEFAYQPGSYVARGDAIARIATGMASIAAPHLHLELRTEPFSYHHGNRNGYYADEPGEVLAAMTTEQVEKAFDLMYMDGILDPSDFIESCRPTLPCVLFVRRRLNAGMPADLLTITGLHFSVNGQSPVVTLSRSQNGMSTTLQEVFVTEFSDSVIQVRVGYVRERSQFEEGSVFIKVHSPRGDSEEDLRIPFSDVRSDDWFDRDVAQAWIRGLVDGSGLKERFYDYKAKVTRAEFLKMTLGALGMVIPNGPDLWYAPHLVAGAAVRNENDPLREQWSGMWSRGYLLLSCVLEQRCRHGWRVEKRRGGPVDLHGQAARLRRRRRNQLPGCGRSEQFPQVHCWMRVGGTCPRRLRRQ